MKVDEAGVIDLFCGIGGLTHGFLLEGFDVIAGIDADDSCSFAYQINNGAKFLKRDIRLLKASELQSLFADADTKILIGCAPCQPFSQYSGKQAQKNSDWELVKSFADIIIDVEPDIVSMENVPRLQHHGVFEQFNNRLLGHGYKVFWKIVYGPDYGLPQERERLILLASKLGEIELIKETHQPFEYKTVREVLQTMPPIANGEQYDEDRLHVCSKLSKKNLQRIRASKPGGTWRDWPVDLREACHTKDSGKGYVSVYGRMEWDKPSPTITTQFYGYGNGRFGHPEQDRAISLREGSLLQTFPLTYEFAEPDQPIHVKTIGRHIGNAVPVTLGRVIAKSIRTHLEGKNE